jgi:uncharacterized integral membrane protein
MLTIGLLLLLVAGAVVADALLENTQHLDLTVFGQNVHLPFWQVALGAFLAGAILLFAAVLVVRGTRRMFALGAERRRLRRELDRRPPAPVEPEVTAAQDESVTQAYPDEAASATVSAPAAAPAPGGARHRRRAGAASGAARG